MIIQGSVLCVIVPADAVDLDSGGNGGGGGARDKVPQGGRHWGPAFVSGGDVTILTQNSWFRNKRLLCVTLYINLYDNNTSYISCYYNK